MTRVEVLVLVAHPTNVATRALDERERGRWRRFHHQPDRDRFATGVALVAELSRRVAGRELMRTRRCAGCGGIDHGPVDLDGWKVSVSHSDDRVVAAIAPSGFDLGVDVERIRPFAPGLAARAFSVRECDDDAQLGRGSASYATTRWVRKEAVLKAARTGITVPLTELEVSSACQPARVLAWSGTSRPDEFVCADVHLFDLDVRLEREADAYRSAIALRSQLSAPTEVVVRTEVSVLSEAGHARAVGSMWSSSKRALTMSLHNASEKNLHGVVARAWADVLQLPALDLDAELAAHGADSIRVFQVAERLSEQGVAVTIEQVLAAPTARALADAVFGRDTRSAQRIDLREEAAMVRLDLSDADLDDEPRVDSWPSRTVQHVLLTGSSSPIGRELVRRILNDTTAIVHLLELHSNSGIETTSSRLHIVGNLAAARELAIDAIFHLAPDLVSAGSYGATRGPIVHSTRDLLDLAKSVGAEFVLLSHVSADRDEHDGRALSQWVAEQLVDAAGVATIRTVIVRRSDAPDDLLASKLLEAVDEWMRGG